MCMYVLFPAQCDRLNNALETLHPLLRTRPHQTPIYWPSCVRNWVSILCRIPRPPIRERHPAIIRVAHKHIAIRTHSRSRWIHVDSSENNIPGDTRARLICPNNRALCNYILPYMHCRRVCTIKRVRIISDSDGPSPAAFPKQYTYIRPRAAFIRNNNNADTQPKKGLNASSSLAHTPWRPSARYNYIYRCDGAQKLAALFVYRFRTIALTYIRITTKSQYFEKLEGFLVGGWRIVGAECDSHQRVQRCQRCLHRFDNTVSVFVLCAMALSSLSVLGKKKNRQRLNEFMRIRHIMSSKRRAECVTYITQSSFAARLSSGPRRHTTSNGIVSGRSLSTSIRSPLAARQQTRTSSTTSCRRQQRYSAPTTVHTISK